jgi:Xaa-Pro dipeptidase
MGGSPLKSHWSIDQIPTQSDNLASKCRARFFECAPHLDAVITTDSVHIGYLCGYRSILHDLMLYPQALIVTRERVALVTGASDGPAALERLLDPGAIWRYGQFFVSATAGTPGYAEMPPASINYGAAVSVALKSFQLRGLCVGMDARDEAVAAQLHTELPDVALVEASNIFRVARAVKLPAELALLRHATRITDEAIAGVIPMIRAGVTELEIAAEISRHMVRNGGIARFVVVTSGDRSALVDAYARPRSLQSGELVRLDIGCTVDGYCSDMARTFAVGEPSALQQSRYDALLAGEQAEIRALRPGAIARDIFELAVQTVRSGALPDYQRNHCGHGIGLRSHEFPMIGPDSETVLEPGMIFCVETPYYELGWGGMMVEDTAIITPDGHELLSNTSRSLKL